MSGSGPLPLPRRGDVVTATVRGIQEFGVLADLEDGTDGHIHIADLSWGHTDHPEDVVRVGQSLSVKVLDVDAPRRRVSLGLRQMTEDPWDAFASAHRAGQRVGGEVVAIRRVGAFVRVAPAVEGLLTLPADDPRTRTVRVGATITLRIAAIDRDRRLLSLGFPDTPA